MQLFLSAFESVPDPRAENTRHDLVEILVIAFVAVLCGATSCCEMAEFGRTKLRFLKRFLKLKHGIPSHDTFSTVLRMIDPKALDAAFGSLTASLLEALADGGVIAIDGKSLKGAYDKGEAYMPRMMVTAYAADLRLTLASLEAKGGSEVEAALGLIGLIDLKGHIVTADARTAIAGWLQRSLPRAVTIASRSRAIRRGFCRMPVRACRKRTRGTQRRSPRRAGMAARRRASASW